LERVNTTGRRYRRGNTTGMALTFFCSARVRSWPEPEATPAADGVRCLGSTCRRSVGPNSPLVTQSGGRQPTFVAARNCYWITSSAVANRVSGMVRPSALAVFMLMRNSIFVDCWTGRSEGLSPLRIRPV
jgi:hypothetical protein